MNFFPTNRALSLSSMDEDSTESKVDDLLHYVMQLVERQKEEVHSRVRVCVCPDCEYFRRYVSAI